MSNQFYRELDLYDLSLTSLQYGFIKSRTTGSVDTDVVYTSGRHFVGPDKVFKTFQVSGIGITVLEWYRNKNFFCDDIKWDNKITFVAFFLLFLPNLPPFCQSTAHLITLENILIFSRDKLEIGITVDLQYFLNKEDLPDLHDEYDLFYKEIFKQTAKDTVKVNMYMTGDNIAL